MAAPLKCGMRDAFTMYVRTFEIPRRQRIDRLTNSARRHKGCPVALDIVDESIGAQPEFRLLKPGWCHRGTGEDGRISITATLPSGGCSYAYDPCADPCFIEQSDAWDDAALEIQAARLHQGHSSIPNRPSGERPRPGTLRRTLKCDAPTARGRQRSIRCGGSKASIRRRRRRRPL